MTGPRRSRAATASPASALVGLLRTAAVLDRSQSDPVVAGRNALGVALPLVIGAAAGNITFGLPSTIGALQTAFADRPGPYRLRMLRMAGTAVAAATTSTLAVLASRSEFGSAALLLVLAVLTGMLLANGPSASQVGVAATGAALVLGHEAQRPSVAWHIGLLVLAGGLAQVLLALSAWPLRRHRPERFALAGLYRGLAQLARGPVAEHVGPPLGDVLAEVRRTLYGLGHDHGPSVEAYRVLLDEGERIRRELIVLGGYAERIDAHGASAAAAAMRATLRSIAAVLEEIAAALGEGRAVDAAQLEPARGQIATALRVLDAAAPDAAVLCRAAGARLRALSGQLRAALDTALTGASEGAQPERAAGGGVSRLRDPLAVVRANISTSSATVRHALRLGVLVAGSDLVVRLLGTSRGYWIPLTILVVLRPDFASTFQRSTMRVLGTIVGLLVASVLVHYVPGGPWYSIALVALFFFGMRLAGPGNLGIGAVCLSALVVVLLALAGVSPHTTVVARAVNTVIGGALALLATLVGPVWERRVLPDRLGDLLAAYRDLAMLIADPDSDRERLQRARANCRLTRTNAQASVDRARAEPVSARAQVELGEAVLAHTHRFAHAMLTLDALRPTLREVGGVPGLSELLAQAAQVLRVAEGAVRTGTVLPVTDLRATQLRLVEDLRGEQSRLDADTAAALTEASDRIANSLDTLVAVLRRQLLEAAVPAG